MTRRRKTPRLERFGGMEGLRSGQQLRGPVVSRTVGGFLTGIRRHRVCAAASDHGAITVWIDNRKQLRAALTRYHSTVDQKIFPTKDELSTWLKLWLPKLETP